MSNTEQVLSAGIGAVVGFFVGGPAGAFAGFQYGLLAGSILFPPDLPGVTGPRLEDFERAEADPGAAVWKCWGRVAVPGFRMYLGEVTEITNVEDVGGKGGPSQEVTTFSYTQTLALGLCEGPIQAVTRIWENGKLVYDVQSQQEGETDEAYVERLTASSEYGATFTLYLGTEEQTADPTMELELGAGNVPGYRGLAYMVFPDRLLQTDQAQRHPVFKIELAKRGAQVGGAVLVACARALGGQSSIATSADGGETWAMQTTPVASGDAQFDGHALAFSPTLERIVCVGDRVGLSGVFYDTMYSDDLGVTWVGVDSGCVNSGANYWDSVIWVPDDGGFFLAACNSSSGQVDEFSFRKSADGETWVGVNIEGTTGRVDNPVGDVCYSAEQTRLVALVSNQLTNDAAMIYSDDFGDTWVVGAASGFDNFTGHGFHVTALDYDPVRNLYVYLGSSQSSFTPPLGATSVDGVTWIPMTDGALVDPVIDSNFSNNGDGLRGRFMPGFGCVVATAQKQSISTEAGELGYYFGDHWFEPVSSPFGIKGHGHALAWDGSRSRAMTIFSGSGFFDIFAYQETVDGPWVSFPMVQERVYWTDVIACWAGGELGDTTTIAEIVEDLCEEAGLTDLDVTDLDESEIDGYAVTRVTNARAAIDPLRLVGLFDYVESGETLRFSTRGKASMATLESSDLGAGLDGQGVPAVTTRKLQDVELPRQIRLRYLSFARDYEKGEQLSPARIGTVGVNVVDIDCPAVLNDDQAAQMAEIIFRDAWASRWLHEFSVDQSFHAIEGADVLTIPVDGRNYRVRVVSIQDTALVMRKAECVRDDDGSYTSTAVATPPTKPPSVLQTLGATEAIYLDLPALLDSHDDPGFYVGAYNAGPGSSWPGATINRSIDAGATYSQIMTTATEAYVGVLNSHTIVGDNTFTWDDESEIVVTMLSGALESRTDEAVLLGANTLAIGLHGRWHLLQFANAELIAPDQYRLTRLLLGRRGTEHLIDDVEVDDTAVLVSGPGVYRIPLQVSEIGASFLYNAVTVGATLSSGDEQEFIGAGQALETFSPIDATGVRDGGDDLTIAWVRRDRLSQTLRDGVETPNADAPESYSIDIMDGLDVARTLVSSDTDVVYTAADQTTDFGSPQASVSVRIFQLSATVGRGTPLEATV